MERTIKFKNFIRTSNTISADLYLEDEFIVKMTDNMSHVLHARNTKIGLYDYFRKAVLTYISYNNDIHYNQFDSVNQTNH